VRIGQYFGDCGLRSAAKLPASGLGFANEL
jgi:hypothetical protein